MKESARTSLLFVIIIMLTVSVAAKIKLPKLISDGMVLQRETELTIWGWASPKEHVEIEFMGKTYATISDKKGNWDIKLPKLKAGGPYKMIIKGENTITIKDILIGDVWLCSGQSNMELTMQRAKPLYEDEVANASNPNIRQFEVPDVYNFNAPQKDLPSGKWVIVTPKTILKFSAVAYFFAKELYEIYKIPIGLINASLGGSPAEAWMSEEALKEFPHYLQEAYKYRDSTLIKKIQKEDRQRISSWYRELHKKDLGYKNSEKPWYSLDIDTTDWLPFNLPGYWADQGAGNLNGVLWFRKTFNISSDKAGKPARLLLGRIIDADSVFVNGIFVGAVSYQYPPRRYKVPDGVLKEGKNEIVIRVINNAGKGGFVPDKPYMLIVKGDTINLKGKWLYKVGAEMPPLKGKTFIQWKPMGLFNAMIAPLLKYKIKGVIWYQGESNISRAIEYRKLFPALIKDWRKHWRNNKLPFLFVQLPNYGQPSSEPTESWWALLREAQLMALKLPCTGMAVTIDIGEWNDIHPLNKKDVGKRLALWARKIAYGEKDIVYSGPIYKKMKKKGGKIILYFEHTGSGLVAKGTELQGFSIAGQDKKFVGAKAEIIGKNKVVVWSEKVKNPVAVRYAWADNPEGANLYNKEGLPASPFRTDNW